MPLPNYRQALSLAAVIQDSEILAQTELGDLDHSALRNGHLSGDAQSHSSQAIGNTHFGDRPLGHCLAEGSQLVVGRTAVVPCSHECGIDGDVLLDDLGWGWRVANGSCSIRRPFADGEIGCVDHI